MTEKELADILYEELQNFYDTLCNPNTLCKDCRIKKIQEKYSISMECDALYLTTKLLGDNKETIAYINKQRELLKYNYCINELAYCRHCETECGINKIKSLHEELQSRCSCLFIYIGMQLLYDI